MSNNSADANRVALRYAPETSWGVIPDPAATFQDLEYTGESLKGAKKTETSNNIRDDRQVSKIIRTGIGAEGGVNLELSAGAWDDFLLALLMASAWSTQQDVVAAGTVSVNATTKTFTIGTSWTITPTAQQWIKVSGFTGAYVDNNGYYKVQSGVSSTDIPVYGGADMVDVTDAPSITIVELKQAVNGVAEPSWIFEREPKDTPNVFMQYTGMMVNELSFDIPTDGILTGEFSFMGKEELKSTATVGDGSPTAPPGNDSLASPDVQFISLDHGSICVVSGSLSITNNLREVRCVGQLANKAIGVGRFQVTGDLEMLFSGLAQKTKYLDHTASGFAIAIEDAAGNGIIIELPSFQYEDDETVAGAVDTEFVESLAIAAFMNATEGITGRIAIYTAP